MLCCKAKLGFSYSICDDRDLYKNYMQISTAQFVFMPKFRNLPYTVFHGYEVIALHLSPVEAVVTRYLVGNCRSLR